MDGLRDQSHARRGRLQLRDPVILLGTHSGRGQGIIPPPPPAPTQCVWAGGPKLPPTRLRDPVTQPPSLGTNWSEGKAHVPIWQGPFWWGLHLSSSASPSNHEVI